MDASHMSQPHPISSGSHELNTLLRDPGLVHTHNTAKRTRTHAPALTQLFATALPPSPTPLPTRQQQRVVANIHGHTHNAAGQSWVGAIPIINPGSLRYGDRYGVLTLRRTSPEMPWRVASMDFRSL